MTDRQLRIAVTEPPKKLDAPIDNELVEALLDEMESRRAATSGPGASTSGGVYGAGVLPLLSHALDQAWRCRVERKRLTLSDYERAGGIEGAVKSSANRAYTSLTPSQQTMARQVFLRLTTTTADGVDTADRVSRDDLVKGQMSPATDQDVETVLEAFALSPSPVRRHMRCRRCASHGLVALCTDLVLRGNGHRSAATGRRCRPDSRRCRNAGQFGDQPHHYSVRGNPRRPRRSRRRTGVPSEWKHHGQLR